MKRRKILNPVVYLQVYYMHLYMKRHNLTIGEFLKLDKQYDILGYLRIGYEPFHLTGEEGVLEEIDSYIKVKAK